MIYALIIGEQPLSLENIFSFHFALFNFNLKPPICSEIVFTESAPREESLTNAAEVLCQQKCCGT